MNLPSKLGTLQEFLEENGYDDWYALFPTRVAPTSAQLKCIFVNFKEKWKAMIEISEAWFQDPEGHDSIAALVCFAIDDCSVLALELTLNFFFRYSPSGTESSPIFPPRHH